MSKIIRFYETGGPEVLRVEEAPLVEPETGEVRLAVEAFGLNRADVMFRSGHGMEQPELPSRLGGEAAGVVEAVGAGVSDFHLGDRVAVPPSHSMGKYGTYGETAIVPASSLIRYPENLSPVDAAAAFVQYLTAYFAFVDVANVQAGQHVLITAASSSTGVAAIEFTHLLGATAIATTRTQAKKQALLNAGADHVIVTQEESLVG